MMKKDVTQFSNLLLKHKIKQQQTNKQKYKKKNMKTTYVAYQEALILRY